MAIPFNWPSEEDTDEYYRRLDQLLADLYDVLRHILLRPRVRGQPLPIPREQRIDESQESSGLNAGGSSPGGRDDGDDDGGGSSSLSGNTGLEQRLNPLPDLVADIQLASSERTQVPSTRTLMTQVPPSSSTASGRRRRHRSSSGRLHRSSRPRHNPSGTPSSTSTSGERDSEDTTPSQCCKSATYRLAPVTCCACAVKVSHSLKTSAENWILVGHELRNIAEDFKAKEVRKISTAERRAVEVKASSLLSLLVPAPFCGSVWTTVILLVGWKLLMRNR